MREPLPKFVARDVLREKLAEHKRHGWRSFLPTVASILCTSDIRYLEGARREGDILVVV